MAEDGDEPARARVRSRWPLTPRDRSLVAALALTGALRLLWAVVVTRTPADAFSDPAQYLRMADGFSRGELPTWFSGAPTAWLAPGYPALLAPVALLARTSGLASFAFLASLVNVAVGVLTVAAAAFLAGRWIAPGARNPAAWIMAIAPAQIYFVSTAHSEVVFGALFLAALCLVTVLVQRADGVDRARPWLWLGAFVGLVMLTRTQGAVALVLPALAIRAWRGSWQGALRASGLLIAGSLVVLVPWTVRNGLQVGVWTYASTGNAVTLCLGNHDDAVAEYEDDLLSDDLRADCYRYSVWDDPELGAAPPWWHYAHPDEGRWYTTTIRRGVGWALTHPVEEVGLTARKQVELWRDDSDAVAGARNYSSRSWAGRATRPLEWLADAWLWGVEVLALVALIRIRRCRQALPIWGAVALLNATVIIAITFPHYRFAAVPLVAVLAGAEVAVLLGRPVEPLSRASRPVEPSSR